jgi:Fe-Mn family superoxide dismutase
MNDPVDTQRRALLGAAATITALSASHALGAYGDKKESAVPVTPAFQSSTELKPLQFNPAKLDGLSERMVRSHWENNYGGSVRALSVVKKHIVEALANKDTPAFIYNELKREHLLRTGSVVLHEYYFDNLGGNGIAGAAERNRIAETFGSFDTWETEFRKIGAGLGGGSGWVVLGFNTHTRQLENYWLADHAHGAAATIPILVMDMYEHSYQMDYGAATAKYIEAFFRNIQWDAVAKRMEASL